MKNRKINKIFKSFCKKEWGLGGEGKKLVSTRFFPRHQILKLILWLLDTVVRAKNVFGKRKFLVITQWGHAERAVYLARKHGVEAYGFYAAEPNHIPWLVKKNRSRERLAAVAAWLDVNILCKQPKFPK